MQTLRTSRKCVAAFVLGLTAIVAGFLAVAFRSDAYLLVLLGCTVFAIALGIQGWREVGRNPHRWQGKGLAAWGVGLPVGSLWLGFILLPHV